MVTSVRVVLGMCVLVLAAPGCVSQESFDAGGCVASEPEMVELDEDLGGFTAESLARSRSGEGWLTDTDDVRVGLTIETSALGPALATRGTDCSERALVETPVEILLRTHDGRVDVVLDGTLRTELEAEVILEVQDLDADAPPPSVALPAPVPATSTFLGVGFELGADGEGRIVWRVTGSASEAVVAELDLPWAE